MREGLSRSLKNLVILARKRASNESTPPRPCKWVRATEEEKKTQDGRRRGARAAHSIARPPDRPAAAINMQKIFLSVHCGARFFAASAEVQYFDLA